MSKNQNLLFPEQVKDSFQNFLCCCPKPETTYPLRLSPESSAEAEGFLELFQDGRFGTICEDTWGVFETDVACRQLSFISTEPQPTVVRLL